MKNQVIQGDCLTSKPMGNLLESVFIDELQDLFENRRFKCDKCGAEWKHKCAEHKVVNIGYDKEDV